MKIQCLAASALFLLALPMTALADEAVFEAPMTTREFHLEHVEVKEANAIVRSLLDVRKSAINQRTQVLMLRDTAKTLDRAAELIALIDVPAPAWTLTISARVDGKETILRTATLAEGRLAAVFGPPTMVSQDKLLVSAGIARSGRDEAEVDWSVALSMNGSWGESAQALELMHDGDVVTLLATPDHARRKALGELLGLPGEVEALMLHVEESRPGADARKPPQR